MYHTGTVFYFSAEDSEALTSWIELITAATLQCDSSKLGDSTLYSETDESDSEKSKVNNPKPEDGSKRFSSLKKSASSKNARETSTQGGSSSLDRKWFFNKANSIYKNALPVPTAQFRSYRKMPTGTESVSTGNFTSHIPNFSPRFESQTSLAQNVSTPDLVAELPKKQEAVPQKPSKSKSNALNYVHTSNPNLCDVTDFQLRSFGKLQTYKHCTDDLSGFVTLEELMKRCLEEKKLNPHHAIEEQKTVDLNHIQADVVYGEVPIRPRDNVEKQVKLEHTVSSKRNASYTAAIKGDVSGKSLKQERLDASNQSSDSATTFCFGKRSGSLKKSKKDQEVYGVCAFPKSRNLDDKLNRSLPRAHKVHDFRKSETPSKKSTNKKLASKEYSASSLDLNEMVFCPQTSSSVQFAQNRSLDGKKASRICRQHSLTSADKKKVFNHGDSTEKFWLDSLRKSDRVADKSSSKVKLKSAVQYTPMSLPLTPDQKGKLNPKFAFELNLDEKVSKSGKFKSFFGKQGDAKKEKTLLGSPKLHRAVFEKHGRVEEPSGLPWHPPTTQVIN